MTICFKKHSQMFFYVIENYDSDCGTFVIIRQSNYVHQLLSQFQDWRKYTPPYSLLIQTMESTWKRYSIIGVIKFDLIFCCLLFWVVSAFSITFLDFLKPWIFCHTLKSCFFRMNQKLKTRFVAIIRTERLLQMRKEKKS